MTEEQRAWDLEMQEHSKRRYEQAKAQAEHRPYWQWITAGKCAGTSARCTCVLRHEKVFHHADPIWDRLMPLHSGCGCRFRAFTRQDVESKGLEVSAGLDYMGANEKGRGRD